MILREPGPEPQMDIRIERIEFVHYLKPGFVAEIVDAQGRIVPTADNDVTFTVGGGRILGVGNGDPSSHESDHADKRRAFNGLCMAIVQGMKAAGEIRIEGASAGLTTGTATITAPAATGRQSLEYPLP